MLQHIYGKEVRYSPEDISIEDVVFVIELYRVADKYDCISLAKEADITFAALLDNVLSKMVDQEHSIAVGGLFNIVNTVYDFEETQDESTKSPIREALMDAIVFNDFANPLGDSQKLAKVTTEVASRVADFGRDMYLGIMEQREAVIEQTETALLTISTSRRCPRCGTVWRLAIASSERGCCWNCGAMTGGYTS